MFYRIQNVEPIEKYILKVYFQNKTIKYYDVSKLFNKWKVFQDLENIEGLFNKVKVDNGGYGISWNDEIDLSCNELWENGCFNYNEDTTEINGVAEDSEEYNENKYKKV